MRHVLSRLLFAFAMTLGTFCTLKTFRFLTVPALLLLALLLFALRIHFFLRHAQQAQVMFRVLLKVFSRHTVIGQLCVSRQLIVFVDDLLRRAAHLALRAGTVKHAVDDIADGTGAIVGLGPRTVFRGSHTVFSRAFVFRVLRTGLC